MDKLKVGDSVALRRRPDVVGTVEAVRTVDPCREWPAGGLAYVTSWGSAYPAYELIAVEAPPLPAPDRTLLAAIGEGEA